MKDFVVKLVIEPLQRCAPSACAVFGSELIFERIGSADAADSDHERFVGGEAFGLQNFYRIAQMRFEFIQILCAEVRRLLEIFSPVLKGEIQVELDWGCHNFVRVW